MKYNPQLSISMSCFNAIRSNIKSESLPNTVLPYWDKLSNGGILFRGTYHELKQQELIISLDDKQTIGSANLGVKIVQLREVIDVNFAKCDMVIHKTNEVSDDLDKKAQVCTVQGTVSTGCFPKWRQVGEDETVRMAEQYLCVKVNEANVFGDLNDGGDAAVWIECKWGGVIKKTRNFKRPHVNQIVYFKIPVPPNIKKNESQLEQYLTDELQTKSEYEVSVWADTHKMTIDNIGSGRMCLSHIAENQVQYQDLDFTDPLTKEKTQYQARVYTGTIRLSSSFWPHSVNSVNCSVWFQDDIPFPGVDLTKLKPRAGDTYHEDLVEHIRSNEFRSIYERVIGLNFAAIDGFEPLEERLFPHLMVNDQFTHNHLLPTYLCKITNPDQSLLDFDEDGFPIRGIRTFGEIAHYVRCIPFQTRDMGLQDSVWCSPDFTMTIKIGTEEDHAILLASLFRTVKHEDQAEFSKWSKVMKEQRTSKKLKEKEELLNVKIEGPDGAGDEPNEGADEDGGPAQTEEPTATTTKVGGLGGIGGGGKKDKKDESETIDDRVFVCMGKATDGSDKKQIWVMTINRTFNEVTFWEVKNHKQWVLKGRILKEESKFMEAYLNPIISKEERE